MVILAHGGGAIKKGSSQIVLEEGELAIKLICLLSGDMRCFFKKAVEQPPCLCLSVEQLEFCWVIVMQFLCDCDRSASWALVNLQCIVYPLKHPGNAKSLFILQNCTVCLPCV